MSAPLVLLLAVTAGYLATHLAADWLGKRYLIVSSAEYLVLGVLLGPQVSGLFSRSVIDSLTPVLTLALGWIGVIVGTHFDIRALVHRKAREFRIGFGESLITFFVVAALELVALGWAFAGSTASLRCAAAVLGAMAIASSRTGIALASGAHPEVEKETTLRQLELSSAINGFVAVLAFGLVLVLVHSPAPADRPLTATEWAVVSIAIGVIGGMLFHFFVGETPDQGKLFVALAGGVILVSGAATYLRVSSLMSGMFFGIVLVNTTSAPARLIEVITRVEQPFYFVLLFLGGAQWVPSSRAWVAPVLLYLAAHAAAKIGGARLAARTNDALEDLGPRWGYALLAPGRVALAIGVSYMHYELPFRDIVFTASIASILLTEFLSARSARAVIRSTTPSRRTPAAVTDR